VVLVVLPHFWEGFVVCDENLALSVMMWLVEVVFVVPLCLPPSEVKLCFAPSEVHYLLPFRLGESQLMIFVVWRPRKYRPGVSKLSFFRRRPYKMGLLVSGVIGHERVPLQLEWPNLELREMVT
jgi:hypothetical protein